jgi:hypothetical protein
MGRRLQRYAIVPGDTPLSAYNSLLSGSAEWLSARASLLDVNEISARSVDALVGTLGGSEYICEVVCEDATTYQHPAQLHVVISETRSPSNADGGASLDLSR